VTIVTSGALTPAAVAASVNPVPILSTGQFPPPKPACDPLKYSPQLSFPHDQDITKCVCATGMHKAIRTGRRDHQAMLEICLRISSAPIIVSTGRAGSSSEK